MWIIAIIILTIVFFIGVLIGYFVAHLFIAARRQAEVLDDEIAKRN